MSNVTLFDMEHLEDHFGQSTWGDTDDSQAFSWQSASRTDVGRVRHINEDALLESPAQGLWAVADGMGGHSRGDYASTAVVNQLRTFQRQPSLVANLQDLQSRLDSANEQCRTAFRDKRPGTTVAALFAVDSRCFFLWAGDSRIYRLRGEDLQQLTTDHTLAERDRTAGKLEQAPPPDHRSAHVLTRAVGANEQLRLDIGYTETQLGDRYLLCSDGLYNAVSGRDIRAPLGQGTPRDACESLVNLALAQGAHDNITVVITDAAAQH
ncbi:MAG: protein phosphatase 2C domain-containing protein [Pseudomonadota bacterium]